MFSCEFSKISKNTFFTEHLRTTAFAFSFSEAANGGVLWKMMFLKISQNSQENTFALRNFQKHLFYRTHLDDCNVTKMGYYQQCLENLRSWFHAQMNTHFLETLTLEVPLYHFFFRQDKLSVYLCSVVQLVYTFTARSSHQSRGAL